MEQPVVEKKKKQETSAGTKPIVFAENGRYIVKLGSAREQFVYRERETLGLSGVMPKYYKAVGYDWKNTWFGSEIVAVYVLTSHGNLKITLDSPLERPSSSQKIIVIDTLGGGVKAEKSFFIDVKIGSHTKSGEQFNLEGAVAPWRLVKKVEHEHKDKSRTSREHGFDMDAKGLDKFYEAVWAAYHGDRAPLKAAMQKIMSDIQKIQQATASSKITFVGSSVLCYFNLTNPGQSEAKLIDPDHPIVLTNENFSQTVPQDVMNESHFETAQQGKWVMPTRDWDEYSEKWTTGFQDGLKQLYAFFWGYDNRI